MPGAENPAFAYPAGLQEYLSQKLEGVSVKVATDLHMRQTAEDVAEAMEKIVAEKKPQLVIWQTGTVDAMRSVDQDDFRNATTHGITAAKAAGAAVILMNLQYNPRIEAV